MFKVKLKCFFTIAIIALASAAIFYASSALAVNPPPNKCTRNDSDPPEEEGDEHPEDKPPPTKGPPEANEGDPINLINGTVWRNAVDVVIPAPGFDLTLTRTYCNTRGVATNAPFGRGWTHSLDQRLHVVSPTEMYLDSGDGHVTDLAVNIPPPSLLSEYRSCMRCHGDRAVYPVARRASHGPHRKLDSDLVVSSLGASGWRITAPGLRFMDFSRDGRAQRFWSAAGNSLDFMRDTSGRLTNVTHSCGQSIVFEYQGSDPRIRRASVPGQQLSVEYEYPASGSYNGSVSAATRTTSTGTTTQSYAYEAGSGYMVRCDTASGLSFHYAYTNMSSYGTDLKNRVAAATWAEPGDLYKGAARYGPPIILLSGKDPDIDWRFTWEWSVFTLIRDGQSFETRYKKDPATDRTVEINHPCGETEFFDYNPFNSQLSGIRRRGKLYEMGYPNVAGKTFETIYDRDNQNRITSVRSALYTAHVNNPAFVAPTAQAPAWQVAYDPVTRQPSVFTDPCGRVSRTDYGLHGLPLTNRIALASGLTIAESFAYTTNGLLAAHCDPCGRTTAYTYNSDGYLREILPPAGPTASFAWNNALGIMTNITLPGPGGVPRIHTIEKDELGRTHRATYPGGLSETFLHDTAGRVTNHTDTAGQTTRFAWHPGGKLAEVVNDAEGLAAAVRFNYSQQMETLRITDPLNREVERYALDGLGRATNVWDIEGRSMSVNYLLGDLVAYATRFDGIHISFAYDTAARVSRVTYQDDTLDFGYLDCGSPAAASNSVSALLWSYDTAGRLTNETARTSGMESHLVYALDLSGLATNTTLSVGSWHLQHAHSFDLAGRIAQQQASCGVQELTRFDYDYCEWSGAVASISNATLTAKYSSDILDRVTNITYRSADSTVLQSFAYSYNAANLITQQVSVADGQAVTNRYVYDGLGRLITANDTSYTYDLAGNRLSAGAETYTYTHNRLDGVTYDDAGNVTSMVRDGVTLALTWNSQHQLVSVSTNNVLAESYQYDTLGRRIATTKLTTEYHVYDGDECIADLDASGNLLRSYTWGPGIDNLLSMTVFSDSATNTYYAVKDHLGSVHALVDHQGQIAASYTYDAWGNTLENFRTPELENFSCRYLFQGREYSSATGLYHFRARWYDPVTGRWLSNDPIGISGGLNLYEFCGNNPVNYRDPDGLFWREAGTKIDRFISGLIKANRVNYGIKRWLELERNDHDIGSMKPPRQIGFYGHMYLRVPVYDEDGKSTGDYNSLNFYWWQPFSPETNPSNSSYDWGPSSFSPPIIWEDYWTTREGDQELNNWWRDRSINDTGNTWNLINNCWLQTLRVNDRFR